jgi:hypothetical protein
VGDRDQGEVVVPADEAAALIVVQPKRALAFAIVLFDGLIINGGAFRGSMQQPWRA